MDDSDLWAEDCSPKVKLPPCEHRPVYVSVRPRVKSAISEVCLYRPSRCASSYTRKVDAVTCHPLVEENISRLSIRLPGMLPAQPTAGTQQKPMRELPAPKTRHVPQSKCPANKRGSHRAASSDPFESQPFTKPASDASYELYYPVHETDLLSPTAGRCAQYTFPHATHEPSRLQRHSRIASETPQNVSRFHEFPERQATHDEPIPHTNTGHKIVHLAEDCFDTSDSQAATLLAILNPSCAPLSPPPSPLSSSGSVCSPFDPPIVKLAPIGYPAAHTLHCHQEWSHSRVGDMLASNSVPTSSHSSHTRSRSDSEDMLPWPPVVTRPY